jgi:uncharacterized protein YkwD/LysM repeat protein
MFNSNLYRFITSIFLAIIVFLPVKTHSMAENHRSSTHLLTSAMDVITEINSFRSSFGLPPYQINQILMSVAQAHSDYQASIGTVTHYGPDGSRPFQRALSAGYPVAGDLTLGGFFSENIAAGENFSASDVVSSWQSDAPHLNTMLSSNLQDIGAGVTVAGDYIYFTIDVGLTSSNEQISTTIGESAPTYIPNLSYGSNKVYTSTPGSDGAIIHVVQLGETIWSIAQIYEVSETEIITLNGLKNNLIYVGDNLIIKPPFTPTPTINIPTSTQQITTTPTPISVSTVQDIETKVSPTPEYLPIVNTENQGTTILLFIIAAATLISGILVWIGKKSRN